MDIKIQDISNPINPKKSYQFSDLHEGKEMILRGTKDELKRAQKSAVQHFWSRDIPYGTETKKDEKGPYLRVYRPKQEGNDKLQ